MNLYDKDDGFKQFTLDEANTLLPEIIAATDNIVAELRDLEDRLRIEFDVDSSFAKQELEEESAILLQKWAEVMVTLGVYPKGYFTVDFKSPVPDTLFCWTYGEKKITHTHKIYENFKERMPIQNNTMPGFEQSMN
ncbi:MAG: DUF2203 family protein [bacterium]